MSAGELLLPTFIQMTTALAAWLDKAAAHHTAAGGDLDSLIANRLVSDMFPLASQIRIVCYQALDAVHRLQGIPSPDNVVAVRTAAIAANQQPGTWADARACLADTIATLKALDASLLDAKPDLTISIELPSGMVFDLKPEEYARDWSVPQFFFHVNTSYSILRAAGAPLGKQDYVPHMARYIRPGTAPKA